ncbi:DUF4115 domain-containing protein [Cyanobium sp. LEGE 06113]|uniref:DUF4115 domain-containing protein n=1 Tax=Cyanobium sp. LEGE 06113 TaxID=1297573 RepID=UPI00187F829B|nr:DUF4115 domain-containing protein [Cyanobium sp. LEGE 06113]MBE9154377.1 DUF4115 domain-containing protein [Cyanobium sp. LEGE 06113]
MKAQPSPESPSHQSSVGEEAAQLLEQELERAKAELVEYQTLINEIPSIYETKFRQQVQLLALEIRRLLEERRCLHQQLPAGQLSLAESPAPPAVPSSPRPEVTADAAPARSDLLPPRRTRRLRIGLRRRWRSATRRLSLRQQLPLLMTTTTAVVLLVVGVDSLGRRGQDALSAGPSIGSRVDSKPASNVQAEGADSATPSPNDPPVSPKPGTQDLRLKADGPCWVEVETVSGRVVLAELLNKGDQRSFPLGTGLRVRAGRPDHLGVAAAGDDDFRPLAAINNLGWKTFLPGQAGSASEQPPPGGKSEG